LVDYWVVQMVLQLVERSVVQWVVMKAASMVPMLVDMKVVPLVAY
jgi:hypothetical protein